MDLHTEVSAQGVLRLRAISVGAAAELHAASTAGKADIRERTSLGTMRNHWLSPSSTMLTREIRRHDIFKSENTTLGA